MARPESVQNKLLRPVHVIKRTLFEWKAIGYGEGEHEIPAWAADRLTTVARNSILGGEDGAKILAQGRSSLRAGQVVGVIAADNCALEILPKIDFDHESDVPDRSKVRRQLVHMLAVVLDIEISAGLVSDLAWQRENLLEILISLFASKLAEAVRHGLPRSYIDHAEDLRTLRGRLDVARQFTMLAVRTEMLACQFDEFSVDAAINHFMKAAVSTLAKISQSSRNQRLLRELEFVYADIRSVPIGSLPWTSVSIDRTNARWRELVNLAALLLRRQYQTTTSGVGRGFSLLFEMNKLFEEYITRMLRRALRGTGLVVHAQGGRLHCLEDEETGARRFTTVPDILIKRDGSVELIIDSKWKQLNDKLEDPKHGVSQSDVYQMMAYERIYRCPRVILLYPHHPRLNGEGGVVSHNQITGCESRLSVVTVDIVNRKKLISQLQEIVFGFGVAP